MHHEAYVLNGNGNRKVLQDFKNQEFLPIKVKNIVNEDEEVILTFPPEPLHINILGPVNQVVEALENLHK